MRRGQKKERERERSDSRAQNNTANVHYSFSGEALREMGRGQRIKEK